MELLEEDGFQASKLRCLNFSWQPFLHDLPWRPLRRLPRSRRLRGCHLALRQLGQVQIFQVLEVAEAVDTVALEQRLCGSPTDAEARAAEACLARLAHCRTVLAEGGATRGRGFVAALAQRREGPQALRQAAFQAVRARNRPFSGRLRSSEGLGWPFCPSWSSSGTRRRISSRCGCRSSSRTCWTMRSARASGTGFPLFSIDFHCIPIIFGRFRPLSMVHTAHVER